MKAKLPARISAYIIDFVLISFITSFILSVAPRSQSYVDSYEQQFNYAKQVLEGNFNDESIDEYANIRYTLEKESVPFTIIACIVQLAYFGTFAFYNNGETLGKKLLKIRIKYIGDSDNSHFFFILRAFLINGVLFSLLVLLSVYITKPNTFMLFVSSLSIIHAIFVIASLGIAKARSDGRGLHDLICGTEVLDK